MDRRALLARSGALALAALAGCSDAMDSATTHSETGTAPSTATTTASPTDDIPAGQPSASDAQLAELVRANAGFALDLHRQLVTTNGRLSNLFVSPYSVSVALGMTFAGARGTTREAMAETLRYTLGDEIHAAFASLDDALESRETTTDPMADEDEPSEVDAFELAVANAVWAAEEYGVADEFAATLDEYYGSGLERAAFATDPSGERERINGWVAEQTDDRIETLLPQGAITPNTVMVLTNAIYFMASWQFEFDPADTEAGTFTALDGTESTVPMMSQHLSDAQYAEVNGHEVVELPYVGESVSMVLVLPEDGTYEQFERALTAEQLFGLFDALGDAEGDIAMPRFQFRSKASLKSVLSDLGMSEAFTLGADFSGMVTSGNGGGIDDVFHEAFVAVDEEGTEAAASTAIDIEESLPPESFDLTFDRPFLFCIRDRPTDAVLFLGRVADAGATTDPGPADG